MERWLTILAMTTLGCSFDGGAPSAPSSPDAAAIGEDASAPAIDASVDSTSLAACHSTFTDFTVGANKYRVLQGGLTHAQAVTTCSQDGGRLAVIETGDELAAIGTFLETNSIATVDCPNAGSLPCAWVSLHQAMNTLTFTDWQWGNGVEFSPTFDVPWDFFEPNDIDGVENAEEDCGQLIAEGNYRFNDDDCQKPMPAVCECHSI